MAYKLSLVFLSLFIHATEASKPCGVLTTCAVEKCLDKEVVDKIVTSSPRDQLFGKLVERFDLVCIAAKCNNECQSCKACHYALEQMNALAQGEKTSGLCPKLENCVETCISEDSEKVISCIINRCNVHCYDGDCPSCKTISRRMFTLICNETGMRALPNIRFEGTCPALFAAMSEEYVAKRRRFI
ncbi:unnamed protein product [Auanema sp. JU1783]|nr:unnamed protein product [Auanema sp. JU1783]